MNDIDYLKECEENWIISFENFKAAKRAKDDDAKGKWLDELVRIEKAITDHTDSLEKLNKILKL